MKNIKDAVLFSEGQSSKLRCLNMQHLPLALTNQGLVDGLTAPNSPRSRRCLSFKSEWRSKPSFPPSTTTTAEKQSVIKQ